MRAVKAAQERFGNLIEEELQRIENMKNDHEVTDFPNWIKLSLVFCLETELARLL